MNKKPKKITNQMLVCEECGGIELEQKAWIDFYTDEVLDGTGDYDESDNWCKTCEAHVNFITHKEFKEKES